MEREYIEQERYLKAEKQVKKIKGFYWHFFWYLIVNIGISTNKIIQNLENGETFEQAFFDFSTFAIWCFWGIGLVSHALKTFGQNLLFSKKWEESKIKEIMNKDHFNN